MLVYRNTKDAFVNDVLNGTYVDSVKSSMKEILHVTPSASEISALTNSLRAMKDVVEDRDIPNDCGVAVEYNIPTTGKRVDFIISGVDEHLKQSAIFVELKQWSHVETIEDMDQMINIPKVSTFVGGSTGPHNHPSYQVWSYTELLKNSNYAVQSKRIDLSPCVYMHNYQKTVANNQIFNPIYKQYLDLAPVYTMQDLYNLRNFIKSRIKYGDKLITMITIDKSKLIPSKSLQNSLAAMLENKPEFVLIDEQKEVFEMAMRMARLSSQDRKKRVMIVKGGPGTGKTVVAINLLVKTINERMFSSYVTKNQAPKEVFKRKLKGSYKKSYIDGLFMGSGSFITAVEDTYGMLLVDEAHRLNAKSGIFKNQGENQIKELIHASRSSVFFIDEDQRVTSSDIGTVEGIRGWAKKLGAEVQETELASQFRCNGSDGYLSWIDNTLEIRRTANTSLEGIKYEFKVFDDPTQMYDAIVEKNKDGGNSRVVAGYCWNWVTKNGPVEGVNDIVIGDFARDWNLFKDPTFAVTPDSIEQIGCIHTVQGLEFKYVGVIIGDDLRYENSKVITDFTKRASSDKSLNGLKTGARKGNVNCLQACDTIIRNTYRTLMTRGLNGCYVYCTDKKLSQHLKEML